METPSMLTKFDDVPCCPDLDTNPVCDVLDMRRRLIFPTSARTQEGREVSVEVSLHTRFTRCAGPLALGDIVYSTTLLPGEKVRLATTDRRNRFSFDSETKLSYRSEQISEEQYRLASLRAFMSDQNSTDSGSSRSTDRGSWDFHGDADGSIGFLSASADANAHGSHNSESTFEYLKEHSAHAQMADSLSVEATHKAHTLSVGEVSTRAHQQGESEDHFESSSREFANPNQCHAVTFLFYRINKTETIKFELISIDRRVIDPIAPTPTLANPFRAVGQISTIAQEVPATSKERLEVEARGLQSQARYAQISSPQFATIGPLSFVGTVAQAQQSGVQIISEAIRKSALAEVDKQLTARGLIDAATGLVSEQAQEQFGFERKTSLPTAGIIVKSCLDDCSICEPELKRKMYLDLERAELENKLLQKQIELLEQSQEYRCCPQASTESEG